MDKRRRALEFNLYDKEMAKATDQLQAIENTRDEQREAKQEVHTKLQGVHCDCNKFGGQKMCQVWMHQCN